MTIDLAHFTPFTALAGGTLVGLAAAMLMLLDGRILGVSGIVGGLFGARAGEAAWRLRFLAGMFAAAIVYARVAGAPAWHLDTGIGTLALAGLLVGIGTRLGSGCTSGHGVCGLARGSRRSLAATACFMAVGIAVVYLARHVARH